MSPTPAQLAEAAKVVRAAWRVGHRSATYLYFIQEGDSGHVKIGLARKPLERLRTLQQANPNELRIRAVTRVLPYEEKVMHQSLAEHRVRGEWFRPHADVLAVIEEYAYDTETWFADQGEDA